jgi:hypothetical protein
LHRTVGRAVDIALRMKVTKGRHPSVAVSIVDSTVESCLRRTALLQVVSVHKVEAGKISDWHENFASRAGTLVAKETDSHALKPVS